MSVVGEIVSRLIAAGTPPDVAAVAVAEAFAAGVASGNSGGIPVDKVAEKRREYDRNRKRNKTDSGGIPVDSGGIPESASSLIDFKKEKKQGKKLPPEWKPSADHERQASELGHDQRWMSNQAEDMRLWARANEHRAVARKLDWDLTFTTWMRRNARPSRPAEHQTRAQQLYRQGIV